MNDLKPCPFCGSQSVELTDEQFHSQGGYDLGFSVNCSSCKARGPQMMEWSSNAKLRVQELWNRRSQIVGTACSLTIL